MRSMLFLPGNSERKIAKAVGSEADGVILDLEDAIAPSVKNTAREIVAQALPGIVRLGMAVRVNAIDTPWYMADLIAVVPLRPSFIMLPKCRGRADLATFCNHLDALEAQCGAPAFSIGALPQITETASSLIDFNYAGVSPRVVGLGFAAEDLSADFGISSRGSTGAFRAVIDSARTSVLIAARVADVPAYDTPYTDLNDQQGLVSETKRSVEDGFAGKMCIHPNQIAIINAAFTPAPDRIAWADRVVEAFAARPDAGALDLDGRMIDRPHLRLARQILSMRQTIIAGGSAGSHVGAPTVNLQ